MNIELMTAVIIFALIILFHELGHYMVFWAFGYNPSIRFDLGAGGAIFLAENLVMKTTNAEMFLAAIMGPLLGFIILIPVFSWFWFAIYFVMCLADIFIMLQILLRRKQLKNPNFWFKKRGHTELMGLKKDKQEVMEAMYEKR